MALLPALLLALAPFSAPLQGAGDAPDAAQAASDAAEPEAPRWLRAGPWTEVGAPLPPLELPATDGSGPVDLGAFVRTADGSGTPRRTLVLHFATWDDASRRLVPAWLDATRAHVAAGRLQVVGIVQEQHADRARLWAAWQGFDGPLLWDPFGLAGLERVPLALAVDEHGIVRHVAPDPRRVDEVFGPAFVEAPPFDAPAEAPAPPAFRVTEASRATGGPDAARARSIARLLLGGDATLDTDVATLESWAAAAGAPVEARFFLGVALRMRSDSALARADDFQRALDAWRAALFARPGHEVARRRIQRFGPQLDKPHAFYGWVREARAALGADAPALDVPLGVGESLPRSTFIPGSRPLVEPPPHPDPDGAFAHDGGEHVRVETAVALNTAAAGGQVRVPAGAARVHVTLRPRDGVRWVGTSEGEPGPRAPELWVELPEGWQIESPLVRLDAGTGGAPLRVEFELSTVPMLPMAPPPDEADGGDDAAHAGDPEAPHDAREGAEDGPPPFPPQPDGTLALTAFYRVETAVGERRLLRQDVTFTVELPAFGGFGDDEEGGGGR